MQSIDSQLVVGILKILCDTVFTKQKTGPTSMGKNYKNAMKFNRVQYLRKDDCFIRRIESHRQICLAVGGVNLVKLWFGMKSRVDNHQEMLWW